MQLTAELEALKNSKQPVLINSDTVALEDELQQCREELELTRNNYEQEIERLKSQMSEVGATNNLNDGEEIQRLEAELKSSKQKIQELESQIVKERERNMQLRMKAGRAFMAALEDPVTSSGGKIKTALYCPDDDNALMRLLQILD